MRKGAIIFVVVLLLALVALAVGPPLFAIVFGGGFDP